MDSRSDQPDTQSSPQLMTQLADNDVVSGQQQIADSQSREIVTFNALPPSDLQNEIVQLLKKYVLGEVLEDVFKSKVNKLTWDFDKLDREHRDDMATFLKDRQEHIRGFSTRVAQNGMSSTAKTAALSTAGGVAVTGIFGILVGAVATGAKVLWDQGAYRFQESDRAYAMTLMFNSQVPQDEKITINPAWKKYIPGLSYFTAQSEAPPATSSSPRPGS